MRTPSWRRQECADFTVPARQAISLARRLQDPMRELLKTDVKHLGLGREHGIIGKANQRRLVNDTVEFCVSQTGCDVNQAPLHLLRHVPGLDFEIASKMIARRSERPFRSREELRAEGLLEGVRWTNAAGFLRVSDQPEDALERAAIHPEQYELARSILAEAGGIDALGSIDRLRKVDSKKFDVSDDAWREMMRELSRPGRDPRPGLFPAELLAPDTDPATIEKGRVLEGIVSNVTSFGVFVDLGIPRDGMVHISEISGRYVRDAREMLSIGQVVRARVIDGSGQRVELTLKGVDPRRAPGAAPARARSGQRGGQRAEGDGGGRGGRGGRGDRDGRGERGGKRGAGSWPEYQPVVRAARSRRDGLVTGSSEGRGGGGRGGGAGRGRKPGGPGARRGARDEGYDRDAVKKASDSKAAYNPFATFFKEREDDEKE